MTCGFLGACQVFAFVSTLLYFIHAILSTVRWKNFWSLNRRLVCLDSTVLPPCLDTMTILISDIHLVDAATFIFLHRAADMLRTWYSHGMQMICFKKLSHTCMEGRKTENRSSVYLVWLVDIFTFVLLKKMINYFFFMHNFE